MKFRAHDTFYIRDGWLSKGMKFVTRDGSVFSGSLGNPMDVFGIGSNMVKSLKYWLSATGLVNEAKKPLCLTDLGQVIYSYDKYLEEIGTLWLVHYKLATNYDNATSWYYLFNEFKLNEFDKEDFLRHTKSFIELHGETTADRSIEDDFTCIAATYVKKEDKDLDPESNLFCPLQELGLIENDTVRKQYKKRNTSASAIPSLVVLAAILDNANGEREIKISSLKNEPNNVGKVFNLDAIALTTILYDLENRGYINVIRTAGLDVIRIRTDMSFIECVEEYYKSLN